MGDVSVCVCPRRRVVVQTCPISPTMRCTKPAALLRSAETNSHRSRLESFWYSKLKALGLLYALPGPSVSALASMTTKINVIDSHLHVWASTTESSTFPYAQAPPDALKDRASTVRPDLLEIVCRFRENSAHCKTRCEL